MPSHTFNDQEIISRIRSGGRAREEATTYLIEQHQAFIYQIQQKLSLDAEHAQDAFTDALMALLDHIDRSVFRGDSKLSTYFYRIFFNKSVDLLRKLTTKRYEHTTYEIPEVPDRSLDLLQKLSLNETVGQLHGLMDRIGQKCKNILLDWGFWGFNMQEIAERNELKHADSAKKQKYKCLQKLMKMCGELRQA